jgi:hypothetical protein
VELGALALPNSPRTGQGGVSFKEVRKRQSPSSIIDDIVPDAVTATSLNANRNFLNTHAHRVIPATSRRNTLYGWLTSALSAPSFRAKLLGLAAPQPNWGSVPAALPRGAGTDTLSRRARGPQSLESRELLSGASAGYSECKLWAGWLCSSWWRGPYKGEAQSAIEKGN